MTWGEPDKHIIFSILIMILTGVFGGYLNSVFSFDVDSSEHLDKARLKYIILGIGAAFMVPVFLNTISSNLIENTKDDKHNENYLIFIGFCLIAAIFSKRFIGTLAEKILEAAKNAERTAKQNQKEIAVAKMELTSTTEKVEDIKSLVDVKTNPGERSTNQELEKTTLIALANNYITKTSVPDYRERIRLKSELGRRMGTTILKNGYNLEDLLGTTDSEGMLVAIAYAIKMDPQKEHLATLNRLSKLAQQLYTKYSIVEGYDALIRKNLIDASSSSQIPGILKMLRTNADAPLISKIEDTERRLAE